MGDANQNRLCSQVVERLKNDIKLGLFKDNKRFPTEYELSQELGVERLIIRNALQILEAEKVIVQNKGLGMFVNPKPLFTSGIEKLSSVSTMIEEAGMEPGTILLDVTITKPTTEEIMQFNLDDENVEELVTIKRIRTADGNPVVYCVDQILAKNFPVGTNELLNMSIFDAIELSGEIRIEQAMTNIEPLGYDDIASPILRCGFDIPLLVLLQRHYSEEGDMVLYSKNYFRADKFNFHVMRKRV